MTFISNLYEAHVQWLVTHPDHVFILVWIVPIALIAFYVLRERNLERERREEIESMVELYGHYAQPRFNSDRKLLQNPTGTSYDLHYTTCRIHSCMEREIKQLTTEDNRLRDRLATIFGIEVALDRSEYEGETAQKKPLTQLVEEVVEIWKCAEKRRKKQIGEIPEMLSMLFDKVSGGNEDHGTVYGDLSPDDVYELFDDPSACVQVACGNIARVYKKRMEEMDTNRELLLEALFEKILILAHRLRIRDIEDEATRNWAGEFRIHATRDFMLALIQAGIEPNPDLLNRYWEVSVRSVLQILRNKDASEADPFTFPAAWREAYAELLLEHEPNGPTLELIGPDPAAPGTESAEG